MTTTKPAPDEAMRIEARKVVAYRITPIYEDFMQPGRLYNSGTTMCMASGEYLQPTDIGDDALSPKIVDELRKTDKARIICDADELPAAYQRGFEDGAVAMREDAASFLVQRYGITHEKRAAAIRALPVPVAARDDGGKG